jgi:integrase
MTAPGIVDWCTAPTDRGPRANNSVRSRIAAVRQFLAYCRDSDVPAPNVTKSLDRLRAAHPRLLGKVQGRYEAARLNADELQRLFAASSDGTWLGSRDQLAMRLLALGLRNTEARTLTWSSVHHDGAIRTVGKSGKLREVYPGPVLTDLLARWRRFYETNVGPATGAAPVLVTWPNRHAEQPVPGMGPRTLETICRRRGALAGLPHIAPHDLRRSLARIMWEATDEHGTRLHDIAQVADALGHSPRSLTVTQESYIGPLSNTGRRAAGCLVD